jgi:PPOX class probable FMN-dependent enzyme
MSTLRTLEELRTLYAAPTPRVLRKEVTAIDRHIERFIALSPFLVIASGNEAVHLDASPRGGEPGFVKVQDAQTLLIPDAPGNNRLDTLQNILVTSQAALLFFIPGVDEMLRIHGTASLRTDPDLLARFAHTARPPKLVIEVKVRGAYMHCAKAMMRSRLWSPDSQVDRALLPSMGEMIKDHAQLDGPVESQADMLKRYADDL